MLQPVSISYRRPRESGGLGQATEIPIGVGKGMAPPRPPNRTCGLPAYGSPVVGVRIGSVWPARRQCEGEPPMSSEGAFAMCSLDAVASADTRRAVQSEAAAHPRRGSRASVPCVAIPGTTETLCASIQTSRLQLPASLPSGRFCCPPLSAAGAASRYYEGSDSCRDHPPPTGLSAYSALPSEHPAPKHVMRPNVAFAVISARSAGPLARSRLRHESAGSPRHAAESGSSSCGLLVRLGLLPTPPRGDAVTSGYMRYDFT